ncbi:MAG: error-prone DNA polymerase, partial [Planctomycetales bacterium]|nr:error-prone DNA polymerase [Planctomycetales bacterium]
LVEYELNLIGELRYEAYFLTVWDLVRFARQRDILCQGRGSAANSAVCYCLGITAVDPDRADVLFERFVSRERNEAPDIDVDFEHERREEVLQYLYRKYGRERAGLAAEVITYRARSAIRDAGKALGLSLDRVDALAKQVDGYQKETGLPERCQQVGIDPQSDIGQRLIYAVQTLIGFPRHLSQHVGGMVMTQGPLCELVPIENAAMEDRTVISWDKHDLDDLGILKVDCLSLGMLTAIRKCFDFVRRHTGRQLSLATIPAEDPQVYDMICTADTMGVFQIESRAQMSMLPRLRPRCYYDLVIEVAIVRPGPIQGQMVHPYLRRRAGEEEVVYASDALRDVLHKTLGVPIFQEQAMRLAVVAAGFTPGEADELRRAMGAWRRPGIIDTFRKKLIDGMLANGLSEEFAGQVFQQIRGFGEYGFPESHAASFALLVYVSAWLKRHYPAAFTAALINSQPMGFYAPAQLIRDARDHGVEVAAVDVNASQWDCTLENVSDEGPEPWAAADERGGGESKHSPLVLRLGMRMIVGLSARHAEIISKERRHRGPYQSFEDFARRTRLSRSVITQLAEADALASLGRNRRQALWEALAQENQPREMPLFRGLAAEDEAPVTLPGLEPWENVIADYRMTGLSLRAHPISFFREQLQGRGVCTAAQLTEWPNETPVSVSGLVLLRQRPSTAKGITFVTLEDETGTANLVVKQPIWERFYHVARRSPAWIAFGKLERKETVIHVVAQRLVDFAEFTQANAHQLRVKSRDFH